MIICKVKYGQDSETDIKTLAPLRRVEFEDQELFTDYLSERLGILIDSYSPQNISEIIFTYIIKEGKISNEDRLLLQDFTDKDSSFHNFNKIKLPISMDPNDYGKVEGIVEMKEFTRYFVSSSKRTFKIDIYHNSLINHVTILGASNFKWIDTKLDGGPNVVYFKREIGKSTLYFVDGEIILQKAQLNAKPFKKKSLDKDVIKYFRHNRYRNN